MYYDVGSAVRQWELKMRTADRLRSLERGEEQPNGRQLYSYTRLTSGGDDEGRSLHITKPLGNRCEPNKGRLRDPLKEGFPMATCFQFTSCSFTSRDFE